MTDPIALDVHAHLLPVITDRLGSGLNWDGKAMEIDGHRVGMPGLFDPAALAAWMEQNAVAQAWISAPPPAYRVHLQGAEAETWAHYLNDGLMAIAAQYPAMQALLHLPTQAPDVALAVAKAAIAEGQNRFAMPTGTGDDRTLSDVTFEPLWSALSAAGAFVFFHPGECADGRLSAFYLTNLLGNPHESAVAISHLVLGGVLERHPGLTPCFAHGGGTWPMLAARQQRGHDTARPGVDTTRSGPMTMANRIMVDCICHSEAALRLSEATFGEGNVVFGSDWPFPMGIIEPHTQLADHEAERRTRLYQDNPRALLERLSAGKDKP